MDPVTPVGVADVMDVDGAVPPTPPARTLVVGVINVTPDSFSDGGQWYAEDVAVAHGQRLLDEGADLLDIGGESTRPGAARVDEQVEHDRVLPVIGALADLGARITVDTMRSSVAAAALDAGAWGVNDVSGGLADPQVAAVVAERDAHVILGHWRGHSAVMERLTDYRDVVEDVRADLADRVEQSMAAGVAVERIVIDPGLGFAKDADANWRLLAGLPRLQDLGFPVLIGASRKRFLGELLASDGVPSLPLHRDRASAAVTAIVAAAGVWGVRVHDVASSADAVRVAAAVARMRQDGSVEGGGT